MNFDSKTVKDSVKINRTAKLPVGIHSDINLDKVEVSKTANGYEYIEFLFKQKESGEEARQRIFFPNGDARQFDDETPQEANQRDVNQRLAHVIVITETLNANKDCNIEAKTFAEFCNKAAEVAMKGKDTTVRLKLVPNSKGYTDFPKYPNYIENQDLTKETRLRFSEKELQRISDLAAPKSDNPLIDTAKPAADLPF